MTPSLLRGIRNLSVAILFAVLIDMY